LCMFALTRTFRTMEQEAPIPWRVVTLEKDGVTFHGRYFMIFGHITVLYGGYARSIQHDDQPPDTLARRILAELVVNLPRVN